MKIVIIGGRGTAIVVADQIYDAHQRFGTDVEVLGLALDDHSGGDEISGYPILCDIKDAYKKYEKYEDAESEPEVTYSDGEGNPITEEQYEQAVANWAVGMTMNDFELEWVEVRDSN